MKGISINEHKLHEVEMPLEPYKKGVVSHLRYPKHRIHHELVGEKLHLNLPCFLALEMYRTGILPQNNERFVTVRISGKHVGKYRVIDVRYPNSMSYNSETIQIEFLRVRERNT